MAEAVGLALAIAPLVISTVEHYSIAAKCIKRYCRYKPGQQELVSVVNIQRTIFRKTVLRLLAYDVGVGEELASEMMKDPGHSSWMDEQIESYFAERMADCSEALKDSIRLLSEQLAALRMDDTLAHERTMPDQKRINNQKQVRQYCYGVSMHQLI